MMRKLHNKFQTLRKSGPGREGFTLVEILMVLMILTVGILPLAIIQHRARREVSESDRYSHGITVAQSQLERIKGLGFGTAAADSGQVGNVAWTANVTNVSFGLDRVAVTASWQNGNAVQSLTVADLVSMR